MGQKVHDSFLNKEVSVETVVEGFVDYTDSFVLGYFTPSIKNVVLQKEDGGLVTVMNRDIIPDTYMLVGDIYVPFHKISIVNIPSILNIVPNKTQYDYSASRNDISVRTKYISKLGFEFISEAATALHQHLGNLSVGIEFETVSGSIPSIDLLESGLIPLRDGSIAGIEYATIPLKGVEGAQTLINCINTIDKYVKSDNSCALHYHFGGVPRTEDFIVAFWRVIQQVQHQLYSMNSPYKCLNWGVKRKNYSKPLPVLQGLSYTKKSSENIALIIEYLTAGTATYSDYKNSLDNISNHPQDPENRQKWNITNRYSIVNFIPLIFGNKQTVEFRMSDITTNKTHIYNEVYLLSSLILFTIKNMKLILTNETYLNGLTLDIIVISVNKSQAKYVRNFIDVKESLVSTSVKHNTNIVDELSRNSSSVRESLELVKLKSNPEFEADFYSEYYAFLKVYNQLHTVVDRTSEIEGNVEDFRDGRRGTTRGQRWGTTGTIRTSNRTTFELSDILDTTRVSHGNITINTGDITGVGSLNRQILNNRRVVSTGSVQTLITRVYNWLLQGLDVDGEIINPVFRRISTRLISQNPQLVGYLLWDTMRSYNNEIAQRIVSRIDTLLDGIGLELTTDGRITANVNSQNITYMTSYYEGLDVNRSVERLLHGEFGILLICAMFSELVIELERPTGLYELRDYLSIRFDILNGGGFLTDLINQSYRRNRLESAVFAKLTAMGLVPTDSNLSYPVYLSTKMIKFAEAQYVKYYPILNEVLNEEINDILEDE